MENVIDGFLRLSSSLFRKLLPISIEELMQDLIVIFPLQLHQNGACAVLVFSIYGQN